MSELKLLGYVVGITYSDGFEWLYNKKKEWCSLNYEKPESNPIIFKTEQEAQKFMQSVTTNFPLFMRPYYYETFTPKELEIFKNAPKRKKL